MNANANFVTEFRNAAPHLLSEIETLRAENERLKAALAWYADSPEPGTFKIVTGDGDFISDLSTWGDRARDALAYNKSKVTT